MVLVKILLVGVLAAVRVGGAMDLRGCEGAGLVSSCQLVAPPAGQPAGGSWYLCREGVMTGFPRLERDNCESRGFIVKRELWHCDTIADPRRL